MTSRLIRGSFRDDLVPDEVAYTVLTPPDWTSSESLPLVLVLHGANSSSEVLAMVQPIADGLWEQGGLSRCLLACASTPTVGGFYLGRWESLVALAFPSLLEREYGIDAQRVSLLGSSMGGYGALKLAMTDPRRWQAVAAVAPALLPGHGPRNTIDVLARLADEMGEHDSVLGRLRANAEAVRDSGLPIFLRCGDRDVFNLHDGAEQLHRALWDLDVGHEYHLVYDADHLGPEAIAAQRAALAFIGAAQRRDAGEDRTDADRELEAAWHAWAEGDRQAGPPRLDAFGPTGPVALRLLLEEQLSEAARKDPTTNRRYGLLPKTG